MTALIEVLTERERQRDMWSADHDDGHTSQDWDRFIRSRLEDFYDDSPATTESRRRDRMVKIAALALAALEADDRGGSAMQT